MRTTGKNCSAVIASYVRRRITHRWNIPSRELFGCLFQEESKEKRKREGKMEGEEGRRREGMRKRREEEQEGEGGGGRRGGGDGEGDGEEEEKEEEERRERSLFHCFNLRPKLWRNPQWDTVQYGNKDIM